MGEPVSLPGWVGMFDENGEERCEERVEEERSKKTSMPKSDAPIRQYPLRIGTLYPSRPVDRQAYLAHEREP